MLVGGLSRRVEISRDNPLAVFGVDEFAVALQQRSRCR